MKLKKIISMVLSLALCVGMCSCFASATDTSVNTGSTGTQPTVSLDLSDAFYVDGGDLPEYGIAPCLNLNTSAPTLTSGEYRYYFTSEGNYFQLDVNTKVTVKVETSVKSSVKIGIHEYGGSDVPYYVSSSRATSHSCTITIPSTGSYCIWIYNNGSDGFKVTGGSITY